MTVDSMKAAVAYVTDEYAKEWQRKTSLETRALAIGTADFALVTIFGVWIDRLALLPELKGCAPAQWVCGVALVMAIVAFGLAMGGAVLFRFKGVGIEDIDAFIGDAMAPEADDREIMDEIARTYLGQLKAGRKANARKFLMLAWAGGVLAVASVGAAAALLAVGATF